jgi:hypothetical protein
MCILYKRHSRSAYDVTIKVAAAVLQSSLHQRIRGHPVTDAFAMTAALAETDDPATVLHAFLLSDIMID